MAAETLPRIVSVGPVLFGQQCPLAIIAGPCVIEGREFALRCAEQLLKISVRLGVPMVFKSSFDKANRTSLNGFRGVGMEEGLSILQAVRERTGLPVVTDVHDAPQARSVANVVDMLQTPAFLCRQTDFIQAVAATGCPVNLKKGQFLAPEDMARVAEKAASTGNDKLLLCERGTTFGYRDLVVDMRALAVMATTGYPVIFDATHSVQRPGGMGSASGGERRFVTPLARAAVAVGVAGIFLETHPDPDQAPCDGPNMVPLAELEPFLASLKRLDEVQKNR
ncbi:MAG: 3-deoxy-8-phosphooctulonate synthase [Magnetococcales bacterium]|nr:3-deoxy-8-phosphooctulonate synthase [Magnetococcales bacterium]